MRTESVIFNVIFVHRLAHHHLRPTCARWPKGWRDRLQALQLEGLAAEMPRASDLVTGWFDEVSAAKLIAAGLVNLSEMNAKVAAGGRW